MLFQRYKNGFVFEGTECNFIIEARHIKLGIQSPFLILVTLCEDGQLLRSPFCMLLALVINAHARLY